MTVLDDRRDFVDELKRNRDERQCHVEHLVTRRNEAKAAAKRIAKAFELRGLNSQEIKSLPHHKAASQAVETLNSEIDAAKVDVAGLDARIADEKSELARMGDGNPILRRLNHRSQSDNGYTLPTTRVYESSTYQKGDGRRSYMQDLVRVQLNMDTTGEARDRLMRHAQDVATLPEYAEYRDLSRTDGSGGYAIPPAWLMDQYVELARPGRAFANLCNTQTLPGGTDSINIPKLLTGTSTAVQTADNAAVTQVDLTDTFINAPVRTITGQQGLAIQLIDQSPIAFDDLVFRDLVADYATQIDRQALNGSGMSGQVLGVHGTSGIQTVAAGSMTIAGVYSAIANAVQMIHTTRFLPPTAIVMHPRRWGWFLSLLDSQQRPLFLPAANSPMNAAGVLTDVASEQVVGQMHGLPVVTDPNIATTFGSETPTGTEDVIYVMRASDIVLWESGIRARVLPETKAQNLTVLLQIYGYVAFSAARYPASIVEVTGLTPPTF